MASIANRSASRLGKRQRIDLVAAAATLRQFADEGAGQNPSFTTATESVDQRQRLCNLIEAMDDWAIDQLLMHAKSMIKNS